MSGELKSFKDYLLFLYIISVISALTPLIRIFKLPRLLKILTPASDKPQKWLTGKEEQVKNYTDKVLGFEKFIYKKNCFKRTLSLYYFLRRSGIPVVVNLGVRKVKDKLEGHGWLTLDGKPFWEKNENPLNFEVIYSYPALNIGKNTANT